MEKITIFYAQKLIDELIDSSSSSDEDEELFSLITAINYQRQVDNTNLDEDTVLNSNRFKNDTALNKANQKRPAVNFNKNQKTEATISKENGPKSTFPCTEKKQQERTKSLDFETSVAHNEFENLNNTICTNESNQQQLETNININKNSDQENTINTNSPCDIEGTLQDNVKSFKFEKKLMSMDKSEFKTNLNVSRETAIYLMEKYSIWLFQSSYQECTAKSTVETNILTFLWFCSNEINFRSLVQLFDTTFPDIQKAFKSVLKFLVDELATEVIKFPSTYSEKEELAKEFEKVAGFPKVLGCVAESYFQVKSSLAQKCGGSYIYLRGICDPKLKFLNVKTGFPKEVNDSFMEQELPKLCSPTYHLLGDSKCPIREHLMIPFDINEKLSNSEKYFNIKLIRTHVKIKNAFGILKSRFRQLKCLEVSSVEELSEFIVGCCVLHNVCIDREDFHNSEIYTDVSDRHYKSSLVAIKNDEFQSDLGLMKRFELKHILFKNKT